MLWIITCMDYSVHNCQLAFVYRDAIKTVVNEFKYCWKEEIQKNGLYDM